MLSEHGVHAGHVGAGDREAQVGAPVVRDVLHDHVDVDPLGGHGLEDRGGDPGAVGHLVEGDLGLLDVQRDPADQGALEHGVLLLRGGVVGAVGTVDPRSRLLAEGVPNVDADTVPSSVLHTPELEDPRARGGELEHLLVGDPVDLAGVGVGPRVGREDAVDIGVDLADVRPEGGRHGDRGGVRATAAERRDVVLGRQALEAGEDHDVARVERLLDPLRADLDDPGLAVLRVGDDAGL